jgi:hypothetical protein
MKHLEAMERQLRVSSVVNDTVREDYVRIKAAEERLAVYLRTHYKEEIEHGHHHGFPTAQDAAIYYMGVERELSRAARAAREGKG